MLIKRGHRYRHDARRVPLQPVGEVRNGSGKFDNALLDVVNDVLARRRAYSQENSLMKPTLVFDFLVGPVFVPASFTQTDQSAIERSEADPFIRSLPIGATYSISHDGSCMQRKPDHDRASWRDVFPNPPPSKAEMP